MVEQLMSLQLLLFKKKKIVCEIAKNSFELIDFPALKL